MSKQTRKIIMILIVLTTAVIIANLSESTIKAAKKSTWVYTKQTSYYPNDRGKLKKTSSHTYKYNNKGLLILSKEGDESTEYKYNSQGLISEEISHYGKKKSQVAYSYYTYTKNGNVSSMKYYDHKKELTSTDSYQYDIKGNPTLYKRVKFFDDGNDEYTVKYNNFYKNGKLSKVEKYEGGSLYEITTYDYYSNGTIKKETETNKDKTYKTVREYNKQGNITQNTYTSSSSKSIYTYTYNKKGDLTKQVMKTSYKKPKSTSKTTYTYSYKYDKNGNKIEEIKKENGRLEYKYVYSGYKKY